MSDNGLKANIAGLSLSYQNLESCPEADNLVSGPALYAAIASKICGLDSALITTVSVNERSSFEKMLNALRVDHAQVRYIPKPSLTWAGNMVQGPYGFGKLNDNPVNWYTKSFFETNQNRPLFLANHDPQYHLYLIKTLQPEFSTLDLYNQWIGSRYSVILDCIKKVNLVVGTDKEFNMLPADLVENFIGWGQKIAVIKKGKHGISILSNKRTIDLPAPSLKQLNCDIGAGDLLFGALSSSFFLNKLDPLKGLELAYEKILPVLTTLLESRSPQLFLSTILDKYEYF